jgi:hypothetical protein
VIVVNWNGRRHLLECLSSLGKLDYPDSKLRTTVVDNASDDGSQDAVSDLFPRVEFLKNSRNLGYVAAVNRGVENALAQGGDYLWIFNNDVVVFPDTLRNLLNVMSVDSMIGVTGPIINSYEFKERIEHAGYKINLWIGRLRKLRYGIDVFRRDEKTADVDSILGCSNLVRAEAWGKIGPLEPVYGIYFEETEFNLRARREGFRVVLVRNARVLHKSAATMNQFLFRRAWLLLRNLFIFEIRNARAPQLAVFLPYFFLFHLPLFLLRGAFYFAKSIGRRHH